MTHSRHRWHYAALVAAWVAVLLAAPLSSARAADLGPVVTLSAAGAGTTFSLDTLNPSAHEARCAVNITSITGTLTVTLYGKDGASGMYYSLLASAALASPGLTVLEVGPALTAAANLTVNDYLPPTWRVGAAVATGPVSATVGCSTVE
jgi:hypothetical protein